MKELLGRLGSLMFEPDAKTAAQEATSADEAAPVASTPSTAVATNVAATVSAMNAIPGAYSDVASVLDVAHVEGQLVGLIENDPGFQAYKRFSDAAGQLADIITDESTRYKAAAKTSGTDVTVLTQSLGTWQTVLATEQTQFAAGFVAGNEQEIQAINAEAAAVESQIVELAQKLSDLSAQKAKLEQDAIQRTAELGKAKIDFESVVQTLTNRYTAIHNKLSKFLGA
jgi:hypothetical protein